MWLDVVQLFRTTFKVQNEEREGPRTMRALLFQPPC